MMANKTLLLFACLSLIILHFHASYGKLLNSKSHSKRDLLARLSDDSKCELLARQLIDLKGIEKCIFFNDAIKSPTLDSMKAKLTKLSPMMLLVFNRKLAANWEKFVTKDIGSTPRFYKKTT